MTKLIWGVVGERYFEAGSDRGVLFIPEQAGVAWNGLVSVTESPSGGEPVPYYVDGVKYLNIAAAEEYEATISAFASPREFYQCDGTLSIRNGLYVTQQPRRSFGLCYRTLLGNDIDGVDYGYKLHLVYNALAAPSERNNATIADSSEPITLSWKISTTPPFISEYKPTAHMVIDSRTTDPVVLQTVEDILYGTDDVLSRLPSPNELIELFTLPED